MAARARFRNHDEYPVHVEVQTSTVRLSIGALPLYLSHRAARRLAKWILKHVPDPEE
jgi:hypothetical protein